MTTPVFGVTPQGFRAKRLIDIKNELEQLFIVEFGDINLDPQSVFGQLIGIYSKTLADIWENMEDVYFSQYPGSATGISLDNVVQLNGLTRLPATRTRVIGVVTGNPGTLIPANSLVRLNSSQEVFFSTADVVISNSNAVQNTVQVLDSQPQAYTVLINSTQYSYSLPTLNIIGTFTNPDNLVNLVVNGVALAPIATTGTQSSSLTAIANALTIPGLSTAVVVSNSIQVTPVLGQQIVISNPVITGTAAPTASVTLRNPPGALPADQMAEVAKNLSAMINTSSEVNSSWTTGPTFTITAVDTDNSYSISVGSLLQITSTGTPVIFLAQNFGAVAAPSGSLVNILTPVAGWNSVTNLQAGATGRDIETDQALRLRRALSLRLAGAATVESIRARILQGVPSVTSVTIFENITMTQSELDATFSADFTHGNTIQIVVDGQIQGTVGYSVSQLNTMNAIRNILLAHPDIFSVVVGGIGNRNLKVNMTEGESITLSFNMIPGPSYIISGGRPPKSYETLVEGGDDQLVANMIWLTKPAGIATFGTIPKTVVDSQGNNQIVFFSRATPAYLYAQIAITRIISEFPANGVQQIAQNIANYGNSLGVGVDVFIQRVQAEVFRVPGVTTATVQLAKTNSLSETPIYVGTDIDITDLEISLWDPSRVIVSIIP